MIKYHDWSILRKLEKIGKTINDNQTNAFIPLKAKVSISANVLSEFLFNPTYNQAYLENRFLIFFF